MVLSFQLIGSHSLTYASKLDQTESPQSAERKHFSDSSHARSFSQSALAAESGEPPISSDYLQDACGPSLVSLWYFNGFTQLKINGSRGHMCEMLHNKEWEFHAYVRLKRQILRLDLSLSIDGMYRLSCSKGEKVLTGCLIRRM